MLNQQQRSMAQPGDQPSGDNRTLEEFTLAMQGAHGGMTIPEVIQYRPKGNQSWRWLLISLMSCIAASGAAVGAFVWLINLPPTADCENPTSITTDRAQLYCAQIAAETGELDDILASLALVGSWTTSHPLYYEVQPLVEQWSWVALQAAQQKLGDSDLEGAVALIDHIPASSPVYEPAQAALQAWNVEWEQGDKIWAEAQAALKNQDWATASQKVIALSELGNRHWRVTQVQELSRQIRLERQARRNLAESVKLASPGGIDQLGLALKTASRIDATTYAYQDAQPYMDRWSDWLLNLGLDQWYASELDGAITLGQNAGLNPKRAKASQELIWLARSRQMAQQSLGTWRTAPDQLMRLYQAMLVANQIPQDSPYYPQAQSSVATWRTHLDDLSTLQISQMAGRVQTLDTLKLAIDQAAKVPQGNPRRVQAQTLIAYWRQEVERLEDRPYLAQAHQLAKANTAEGLQQAIAMAHQIPLNRALRNEAQSWIYVWQNQIEVLEDRPYLIQARGLARDGNLSQAIAAASNIKPGRALFDEAQGEIAGWRREINVIEQARRRALQQSAARQSATDEAAQITDPLEDSTAAPTAGVPLETGAGPTPTAQPIAPAPVRGYPSRQSLPVQLETLPGAALEPDPVVPALPVAVPPSPLEPSPASGTAAPESLRPPIPTIRPEPRPVPIDGLVPVPTPLPVAPIPAAPAPQLPVAPESIPQSQNGTMTPAPVSAPAVPDAAVPAATPSVSAAPAPEQAVSVKTTKDVTVLYTGALYARG